MTIDRPWNDWDETSKRATADTDDESASLSEMLAVLSRRPERRILYTLWHEDAAVSIEALARAVGATGFSPATDGETEAT